VQGVVSNKDLSMKSPVLRLAGSGSISLPARTINYRAVPTLVSSLQGQGAKDKSTGLNVPLLITGPWSAISITPDLEGILTNALTNPEALKENIKGVKEGLKDFNSPKDIGKALLGGTGEAAPTPAAAPATGAAPVAKPKPAKEQLINDAIGGVLGGFGK
jgi:AsmA protein